MAVRKLQEMGENLQLIVKRLFANLESLKLTVPPKPSVLIVICSNRIKRTLPLCINGISTV